MLDLDRLRELATTLRDDLGLKGPWMWSGNTKHDVYLSTVGNGRQHIIGATTRHEHVTYTENYDDIARTVRADDCYQVDCAHRSTDWNPDDPTHARDTPTLAVRVHGDGYARLAPAYEIPVFEVARDVQDETDPRVYRHDIVGLRTPVAEYLAALDADSVLELLDQLAHSHARIAELEGNQSALELRPCSNCEGTGRVGAHGCSFCDTRGRVLLAVPA